MAVKVERENGKPAAAAPTIYRPTADHVVVRWVEAVDKTTGGLYLPDVAKDQSRLAMVLAVGPGLKLADGTRAEMETKAGDKVVVSNTTRTLSDLYEEGTAKKKSGVAILREHEILAIVEEG